MKRPSTPVLLGAVAALALGGAPALARAASAKTTDPAPPPVKSITMADTTGKGAEVKINSHGEPRRIMIRKLIVQPGATGGWHTHAGEQIAVISQGTLTRYDHKCRPTVYGPGDAVQEPADPRDIHIGINEGIVPLELTVVEILPKGAEVAVPANNPGCSELP